MSDKYDEYLAEHRQNVKAAFLWLKEYASEIFTTDVLLNNVEYKIENHDASKNTQEEYEPYDRYFYGNDKSFDAKSAFDRAWLYHIHRNPHHWQYWILTKDEPDEENILIDIPDEYIIEMICDWWSFSFKQRDLTEIFKWYNKHKDYIQMSESSRNKVENILGIIELKLNKLLSDEKYSEEELFKNAAL